MTAAAIVETHPTWWSRPADQELGVMRVLHANSPASVEHVNDMYRLLGSRLGWPKRERSFPASLIPGLVADEYVEVAGEGLYRLSPLGVRVLSLGKNR